MVSGVPVPERGRSDVVAGESDMMKHKTDHPCLAQLMLLEKHGMSLPIARADLPVRIGRSADCQMRLEEMGVWDHHVELDLDYNDSFLLRPASEASTLVNDEPLKEEHKLANGDMILLGKTKVQFLIGPVRQRSLDTHEALCWMWLAAFAAAQVWLILWLG
jgi:hypothetical protein